MNLRRLLPAAAILIAAAPLVSAQAPATAAPSPATNPSIAAPGAGSPAAAGKSYDFDVPATTMWLDTKLDLLPGAEIQVTAAGSATYPAANAKSKDQTFGPDGLARGFRDLIHDYPVSNSGHGALIGRLGSSDSSAAFALGASQKAEIPAPGRLFLGINQGTREAASATGSFHVTIAVLNAGSGTAGAPFLPDTPFAGASADLLATIPRRVSDPSGNPGDMVNVLVVGTQDQLTAVFKAAGWVQVDRSVQDTIIAGALATFSKDAYLTMPMSTLYLFDRPQDFGFAHAEPVKVVESRNHLRAWKSPYELDGRPVWCIAATHDIGFERDQRNNGLTHKIDPAIDGEREYVNDTLSNTGLVAQRDHVAPSDALTTAKTATGGEFHSDGRILLLVLKETPASPQ